MWICKTILVCESVFKIRSIIDCYMTLDSLSIILFQPPMEQETGHTGGAESRPLGTGPSPRNPVRSILAPFVAMPFAPSSVKTWSKHFMDLDSSLMK